jgi:hypothetical protein
MDYVGPIANIGKDGYIGSKKFPDFNNRHAGNDCTGVVYPSNQLFAAASSIKRVANFGPAPASSCLKNT